MLKGTAAGFHCICTHQCIGTAFTKRCPLSYTRVISAAMGPVRAQGARLEENNVPTNSAQTVRIQGTGQQVSLHTSIRREKHALTPGVTEQCHHSWSLKAVTLGTKGIIFPLKAQICKDKSLSKSRVQTEQHTCLSESSSLLLNHRYTQGSPGVFLQNTHVWTHTQHCDLADIGEKWACTRKSL